MSGQTVFFWRCSLLTKCRHPRLANDGVLIFCGRFTTCQVVRRRVQPARRLTTSRSVCEAAVGLSKNLTPRGDLAVDVRSLKMTISL